MFPIRLSCLIVFLSVGAFVSCSQTPTSPSSVTPGAQIGTVPQLSVPVPPQINVNPPRALGVTRFVAFGDSITWGATSAWDPRFVFATANGGYPERLEAGLNTYHAPQRFSVFNDGLPGELAVGALTRFRAMLTTRRPEVVLLLEGINDLANDVSVSRIGTALRQMMDAATAAGAAVVVATMFPTYEVTDPDGNVRTNGAALVPEMNAEIRRVSAGRTNVHLLDLEPRMRNRRYVGADGIHLTDEGFEVMSAAFLEAVERAFPVRGSFQ